MKLLGAGMIVLAAFLFGWDKFRGLKARVDTLRELTASVHILRGEICSGLRPMEEAVEAAANTAKGQTSAFYSAVLEGMKRLGEQSFRDIWTSAAEAELTAVTADERTAVIELGAGLGRYDIEREAAILDRTAARLEAMLSTAETAREREGRLRLLLPVAAAMFAVIIML